MIKYINKDALVAYIERRIQESIDAGGATRGVYLSERMKEDSYILSFIDTLEVKEVDFDKEIETHLKDCLDAKFPTTDIELIKKDVTYTAKKFFELGFEAAQKGE